MYINDPSLKEESVDEQTIIIPTAAGWRALQSQPMLAGLPLGSTSQQQWLWDRLNFVQQYPELTLSLYRPGEGINAWLGLVLFCTGARWQRVHLERLTCNVCQWTGYTANPLVNDLYVGVPDKKAALVAASQCSLKSCPKCSSKLPRHPIWVEPSLE